MLSPCLQNIFYSQKNGQLVLENQSVAAKEIKSPKHLKGEMLSQVCDCAHLASPPWLISGCEAVYKAVGLLLWQVPKGIKVKYGKEMGSYLKIPKVPI